MPLTVRTEESTPVADIESLQQPCKPGQLMLSRHQYVQQEHISNTGNKSRQSHQYQPTQYSLGMLSESPPSPIIFYGTFFQLN